MNKCKCIRRSICIVLTLAIMFSIYTTQVFADTLDLKCKSYILLDADSGEIILENNSHEKLPPASVTKVMTMLMVMEAIDSGKITLQDKVTISKQAESRSTTGTMLLLDEGEVRTVHELLLGIAVESANDACIAIAEYISGSEEEFVKQMNKRAKELGMNDTNFMNSNGLHIEGHVTSAYDIGIMSKELVKHKGIFDYISKYMVTVNVGKNNDIKRELVNKNKMVRFYNDVDGIKTGFTNQAMFCIAVTAKKNNLRLISVILGAPDVKTRNREARKLLDYGFANYTNHPIAKSGDILGEIKVIKGDKEKINLVCKDNISLLLKKGTEKAVDKVLNIPEMIHAPVTKGQQIGEVIIKNGDVEYGKYPLVADCDVTKASFINNLRKSLKYWFGN
ncbi:MAG: D-alanyl-D-alanine carboxypeptidase family protein [Bacillota bacterium]